MSIDMQITANIIARHVLPTHVTRTYNMFRLAICTAGHACVISRKGCLAAAASIAVNVWINPLQEKVRFIEQYFLIGNFKIVLQQY